MDLVIYLLWIENLSCKGGRFISLRQATISDQIVITSELMLSMERFLTIQISSQSVGLGYRTKGTEALT